MGRAVGISGAFPASSRKFLKMARKSLVYWLGPRFSRDPNHCHWLFVSSPCGDGGGAVGRAGTNSCCIPRRRCRHSHSCWDVGHSSSHRRSPGLWHRFPVPTVPAGNHRPQGISWKQACLTPSLELYTELWSRIRGNRALRYAEGTSGAMESGDPGADCRAPDSQRPR